MKKILMICLACCAFASSPVMAQNSAAALGSCMVDNLNGKERKSLAQWIFFAIAAHPDMTQFAQVNAGNREASDMRVGGLVTRLLTEDCPVEAKAAFAEGGSVAMEQAFGLVGQVAMQELMTDQSVNSAIAGFEKYLDADKLNSLQ